MNRAPAFQFYPEKWLAGTSHLSDSAYVAYHRLLCWIWVHTKTQYSVVNNAVILQRATQCKGAKFRKVWAEIMQPHHSLLTIKGKAYVSKGLRKEAIKQKERRAQCQRSANARWEKCERNANASSTQCSVFVPVPPTAQEEKNVRTAPVPLFSTIERLQKAGCKEDENLPLSVIAEVIDLYQAGYDREIKDQYLCEWVHRIRGTGIKASKLVSAYKNFSHGWKRDRGHPRLDDFLRFIHYNRLSYC